MMRYISNFRKRSSSIQFVISMKINKKVGGERNIEVKRNQFKAFNCNKQKYILKKLEINEVIKSK